MKFFIQLVATVGLLYSMSGCSTQPSLEGLKTANSCGNAKCKCVQPCQCKPTCTCGTKENFQRDAQ